MSTFNTVTTERDLGLDSMTEVWRAPLCGQTKKLVVLGFGPHSNRTTGKTKIVFTLLDPSMVTLGMMCLVITAITTPVLKVLGVARFKTILIFMFQIVNLRRHLTTLKKDVTQLQRIILRGNRQVGQIVQIA